MKKKISFVVGLLLVTVIISGQSPQDIVDRADQAFMGDRIYSKSSITVYKSNEAQPVQEIESFSMKKKGKSHALSIYLAPGRMKGSANLMIEEDLWVRFSSTGRIRKLSSSAKKNSAGGSDFSYADMGDEGGGVADKYKPSLIGEESVEGEICFVIELIASNSSAPYEKLVVFITKDTYRYMKIDYYESGANIKSLFLYDYRIVDGKAYPFAYTMFNHTKPSRTEVVVTVFETDSPKVKDRFFTISYLETIR